MCESLYKFWPRTGLLCNLCGPGLLFSVRTRSWCRFRCVHAPLAHRRSRRGAAPIVQIHWLQYSGESLYMKVGHETKFSKWAFALSQA